MVSRWLPDVKIGVDPTSADAKLALWRALSRFVHVITAPGATVTTGGWYAVAWIVRAADGGADVLGGGGGGGAAGGGGGGGGVFAGANGFANRGAVRNAVSVSVFMKATSAAF